MTLLGPGIGKKDPDFLKCHPRRQGVEEFQRFTSNEMTIGHAGMADFSFGADDPVAPEIHPDAKLAGVFRRIAHKKMAMAATNLEHDATRLG